MVDFGRRIIKVQGTDVELDTVGDLPIADLSTDMDQVASKMAWWASVWSAAESEKIKVDALYRSWRGRKTAEILERNEKEAEWKVRAAIEADPKFMELKSAIAVTEENATLAKGVFEAFSKKGNMLQSRGAMARGELAATGMTTPDSAPKGRRPVTITDDDAGTPATTSDARADRMRQILNSKKKKTKEQ